MKIIAWSQELTAKRGGSGRRPRDKRTTFSAGGDVVTSLIPEARAPARYSSAPRAGTHETDGAVDQHIARPCRREALIRRPCAHGPIAGAAVERFQLPSPCREKHPFRTSRIFLGDARYRIRRRGTLTGRLREAGGLRSEPGSRSRLRAVSKERGHKRGPKPVPHVARGRRQDPIKAAESSRPPGGPPSAGRCQKGVRRMGKLQGRLQWLPDGTARTASL